MSENPLRDAIAEAIRDNDTILFMKGTPEAPACGFSARATACLQSLGAPFAGVSACGGASMPSVWASSPDWYISETMSHPPTSSPSTNSCGIVGQSDSAESSWRIRGSGRMSTAAKRAPSDCRMATVRAEKPHAGASGLPFMNRITGFSSIASWMASRSGLAV